MPEDSNLTTLNTKKLRIPALFRKIICISLCYLFENRRKIISFEVKNIAGDNKRFGQWHLPGWLKIFEKNRKRFCLKRFQNLSPPLCQP